MSGPWEAYQKAAQGTQVRAPVQYVGDNAAYDNAAPTPMQAATVRALTNEGAIDQKAPAGSPRNPYGTVNNQDVPGGSYYVTTNGGVQQMPVDQHPGADAVVGSGLLSGYDLARARYDTQQRTAKPDIISAAVRPFLSHELGGMAYMDQALRNALGDKSGISAKDASDAQRDAFAQASDQFSQDHPAQAIGGAVLGGILAGPEGAAQRAILPRLAASAPGRIATGTALGGVYGAASAPDGDTLNGALDGALMGGTLGGTLEGVAAGSRPLQSSLNSLLDRVRGLPDTLPPGAAPDITARAARQAARYVGNKVAAAGKSPDDLVASPLPITAAESIGMPGQVGLAALARRSGATPDNINTQLAERASQRGQRLLEGVQQATGISPDAARGDVEAIIAAGQAKAAPLYEAVTANPNPIINPELAALSNRPAIQRAMRSTYENIQNAGGNPEAAGLKIVTKPNAGGGTIDQTVQFTAPTAKTWDMVKKTMGAQVDRHPITGKPLPDSLSPNNSGITSASTDLTNALKQYVPGYREAVDTAGEYKSVEGAYNRARGWLFGQAKNQTPTDFGNLWEGVKTSAERDAIRSAMASDIYDAERNGLLNMTKLKRPAVYDKLRIAFGDDGAAKLAQTVENESQMAGAEKMIRPHLGTQTQPLRAEMAEQDGGNFATQMAADAAPHVLMGNPKTGVAVAVGRQLAKIPAVARTVGMPVPVRDEAGRLLSMAPDQLGDYLSSLKGVTPTFNAASLLAALQRAGASTPSLLSQK